MYEFTHINYSPAYQTEQKRMQLFPKKEEKGINHGQNATLSGFLTDENVCPILKNI
ncbi:hypothetical protein Krac_7911 [Ktedonobacter racemifer DSM 44963]|uniref:Uncharacterized protein n=1 Tax=Ktedonobacter racemifer DSM 44963 TaxID=485913 RepID=D6TLF6_KTERA|nr:hypothetical protein Krac_7911 [Ktedonobacter racemifer DSM 44963]